MSLDQGRTAEAGHCEWSTSTITMHNVRYFVQSQTCTADKWLIPKVLHSFRFILNHFLNISFFLSFLTLTLCNWKCKEIIRTLTCKEVHLENEINNSHHLLIVTASPLTDKAFRLRVPGKYVLINRSNPLRLTSPRKTLLTRIIQYIASYVSTSLSLSEPTRQPARQASQSSS